MERKTVRGCKKGHISSVPVGDDIISQLPKDAVELILERVPIRDAVKTSILSKNWRYIWTSIKKLTFDEYFLNDNFREEETEESRETEEFPDSKHAEIVHHILLQHRGSVNSFHLHVHQYYYGRPMILDLYNRSLQLVASKGVKDCMIKHGDEDDCDSMGDALEDFPKLFSCSDITKLFLQNFVVSLPPTFTGFANLVRLGFWSACLDGESLQSFISSCPKLEHLTLGCCRGPSIEDNYDDPSDFIVHASNLKHLKVVPLGNSCFYINMKTLETLSVRLNYSVTLCPIRPLAFLDCLKRLKIVLSSSSHQEMLVCLFQSAPNLLELKMELCLYNDRMEEIAEFWEASENQVILKLLKLLKIRLCYCGEEELFLLKVLLARTPALEQIYVSNGQGTLSKLVQYPRASKAAKLVFGGLATDWYY